MELLLGLFSRIFVIVCGLSVVAALKCYICHDSSGDGGTLDCKDPDLRRVPLEECNTQCYYNYLRVELPLVDTVVKVETWERGCVASSNRCKNVDDTAENNTQIFSCCANKDACNGNLSSGSSDVRAGPHRISIVALFVAFVLNRMFPF